MKRSRYWNKQVRRSTGQDKTVRASMTVEAAMVVPLFLFAVMNLFSAVNDIAVHMRLETAMHRVGLELARTGYAYHKVAAGCEVLESEIADVGFSLFYVRERVADHAGREFLDRVGISGDSEGISFLQSKITDPEYLDLSAVYTMGALFLPESFSDFQMVNRARLKVWTGYDNTVNSMAEDEGEVVYITEQGEVYHLLRSCSHLQLTISQVSYADLSGYRNENGAAYHACERCAEGEISETVYITQEGDCYHTTLSCGSLRRTVLAVYLSEVGDRRACSRCGSGR